MSSTTEATVEETAEDTAFRAEVRAWLDANAPLAGGAEGDAMRWQSTLVDAGWAAVTWPSEFGGRGGTSRQQQIFNEELSHYDVPVARVSVIGATLAAPTILAHGTDTQKKRYLLPIIRAEEQWCQLFSEPGAGSDLAGLTTRAVRDGDEWIVNGQKVWTTFAHEADYAILVARTDPDQPKHRGLTYFLINMRQPGIEVRPLRQMSGDADFNEVFLTDARVAHDDVLGEVNGGWGVAMTTLSNERVLMGGGTGTMAGGVRRRFAANAPDLIALAQRYGVTRDPVVRQELARAYIDSEILRYLAMRAKATARQGGQPGPESSVVKLFSAHLTKRMGELALAIQGPYGALNGDDAPDAGQWQYSFLRAPSLRIAGGTDQIQRNIIGERVLGLPGEPRVDKDVPFRDVLKNPAR